MTFIREFLYDHRCLLVATFLTAMLAAAAVFGGGCATKATAQSVSATFQFTWPGDDGNVGTASSYEIRLATVLPAGTDTLTWWNNAPIRRSAPPPVPKIAGTTDSVTVTGLASSTRYYAIMRASDEVPNISGFSNIATKDTPDFIPPAPITNLR